MPSGQTQDEQERARRNKFGVGSITPSGLPQGPRSWDEVQGGALGLWGGDQRSALDIGQSVMTTGRNPSVLMGLAATEGFRLRDEEDRRHDESLSFLRSQFDAANRPTISDDTARQMYSREADAVAGGAMQDFSGLRSALGGAGMIGGGLAAGLGSQIELSRLGQLSAAKREVTLAKAQADAQDRIQQFQRSLGVTSLMNESPSLLGLDTLGSLTDISLGRELGERQVEAARLGADATRSAGRDAMWGSIIGGGLGLLGSL